MMLTVKGIAEVSLLPYVKFIFVSLPAVDPVDQFLNSIDTASPAVSAIPAMATHKPLVAHKHEGQCTLMLLSFLWI